MKKILIPILSFVALLVILGIILWFNIPNIAARKLSDIFGVPVSMEDVSLTTRNLIKNPRVQLKLIRKKSLKIKYNHPRARRRGSKIKISQS